MSSRDQPFSDRASVFWGHHRLLVKELTGIAGQSELGLQRHDALVGLPPVRRLPRSGCPQ